MCHSIPLRADLELRLRTAHQRGGEAGVAVAPHAWGVGGMLGEPLAELVLIAHI